MEHNPCLGCHTPCGALAMTNKQARIDNMLIPYWAIRIPGALLLPWDISTNHLCAPFGATVWSGCVYPKCVLGALFGEWELLAGTQLGVSLTLQCSAWTGASLRQVCFLNQTAVAELPQFQ